MTGSGDVWAVREKDYSTNLKRADVYCQLSCCFCCRYFWPAGKPHMSPFCGLFLRALSLLSFLDTCSIQQEERVLKLLDRWNLTAGIIRERRNGLREWPWAGLKLSLPPGQATTAAAIVPSDGLR